MTDSNRGSGGKRVEPAKNSRTGRNGGGDKPPAKFRRGPGKALPGCMGAVLYFMFVVGVSALIAAFGWKAANEVLALNKEDLPATVEIRDSDSIDDIANTLKEAGVISDTGLFKMYSSFSKAREKIDPGRYNLNANMDYLAIVRAMSANSKKRETVDVTIPEGYDMRQIFELLDSESIAVYEELMDTAKNYDFEYDFIKVLPKGEKRLEGYLFPDTYTFYVNEKPQQVIGRFLSNFNRRFNADLRARAEDIGMSMQDAVIIASLIEKEAANDDERPIVSSVIQNRMQSDRYPYLQIDATIQYVLPKRKANLSEEDTKLDNPYNTYKYKGLPPGPIANPGLASVRAALYPEDTNYYFYALDKDKTHKFFRTYEEHTAFLKSLSNS